MTQIEIWASGGGTNADAIIKHFSGHTQIKVVHLGCNRRDAGAFRVADGHGISSSYWSKANWESSYILEKLEARNIDYIILAGFLKLVPKQVIEQYDGRILNIHPSLLPKYGGQNMYGDNVHKAVLASGDDYTGITIHEVNEEFDKGKPIAQFATSLNKLTENLTSIRRKIQSLEHNNFPQVIEAWIKSKAT